MTIKETEKFATETAASVGGSRRIFALVGDLGAGKTTFSRFFLRALGIEESVTSPTFVIMKKYRISESRILNPESFSYAYHIDCYRLKAPEELLVLGFADILTDKKSILLIEWADRIRDILPPDAIWIDFAHVAETERRIAIHKS